MLVTGGPPVRDGGGMPHRIVTTSLPRLLKFDPAARVAAMSSLRGSSDEVAKSATEAEALLRRWLQEIEQTPQRRVTIEFPFIDRTYGRDDPKKNTTTPATAPSPTVSVPPPQAPHTPDKADRLLHRNPASVWGGRVRLPVLFAGQNPGLRNHHPQRIDRILLRTGCRRLCNWVWLNFSMLVHLHSNLHLSHDSITPKGGYKQWSGRTSTTLADLFVAAFHGFVFCSMGIAEMAAEE